MRVQVTLNGHLSWYTESKEKEMTLELPEGATVGDLIEPLGVPPVEVAFATVEDERVATDYALAEGTRVSLAPVIAGG